MEVNSWCNIWSYTFTCFYDCRRCSHSLISAAIGVLVATKFLLIAIEYEKRKTRMKMTLEI